MSSSSSGGCRSILVQQAVGRERQQQAGVRASVEPGYVGRRVIAELACRRGRHTASGTGCGVVLSSGQAVECWSAMLGSGSQLDNMVLMCKMLLGCSVECCFVEQDRPCKLSLMAPFTLGSEQRSATAMFTQTPPKHFRQHRSRRASNCSTPHHQTITQMLHRS